VEKQKPARRNIRGSSSDDEYSDREDSFSSNSDAENDDVDVTTTDLDDEDLAKLEKLNDDLAAYMSEDPRSPLPPPSSGAGSTVTVTPTSGKPTESKTAIPTAKPTTAASAQPPPLARPTETALATKVSANSQAAQSTTQTAATISSPAQADANQVVVFAPPENVVNFFSFFQSLSENDTENFNYNATIFLAKRASVLTRLYSTTQHGGNASNYTFRWILQNARFFENRDSFVDSLLALVNAKRDRNDMIIRSRVLNISLTLVDMLTYTYDLLVAYYNKSSEVYVNFHTKVKQEELEAFYVPRTRRYSRQNN